MIDKTKQQRLEIEKNDLEKNWRKNGRKTIALQLKMKNIKEELRQSKKDQNSTFKSFQKKQEEFFKEKQNNDLLNFRAKAAERQKAKKSKSN